MPAGARGAEAIIRYNTTSLTGPAGYIPGYVDKTHLGFSIPGIPEPATALMGLAGIACLSLRRRRM